MVVLASEHVFRAKMCWYMPRLSDGVMSRCASVVDCERSLHTVLWLPCPLGICGAFGDLCETVGVFEIIWTDLEALVETQNAFGGFGLPSTNQVPLANFYISLGKRVNITENRKSMITNRPRAASYREARRTYLVTYASYFGI